MERPLRRLAGIVGSIAFLVLIVVVTQSCSPFQQLTRSSAPPMPVASADAYVGAEACKGCHEDSVQRFAGTKMGRLFLRHPRDAQERMGCENCHGPGKAHADAGGKTDVPGFITFGKGDKTPVAWRNQMCVNCHKQGDHLFWTGSAHEGADVACTSCHKVMIDHSPKSQLAKPTELETCRTCHLRQTAQAWRSAHMPLREGKMSCTSCHNPHGTASQTLLREASLNDTCYTCHAEKRGPFLWEHAPVVESCVNCHEPHGSNHERMLKVARPRLCQQCHIESRHPTSPYSRDTGSLKFVMGRSCSNCHTNIHGSNHPSGFAFTR